MRRLGPGVLLAGIVVLLLAPQASAQSHGACCIAPSWQCFVLTQSECAQNGGTWFGAGTTCDPNP